MPTLSLDAEELDDLTYYARVGDLVALTATITQISTSHSCTPDTVLAATLDEDDDRPEPSSGCCLLHWPAANGNEAILSYLLSLLSSKPDATDGSVKSTSCLINHKNKNGNTPLHWAAVNGHISCVKALVNAGADPLITNNAGHDALYEADSSAKEGGREVSEWILANCAGLEKARDGEATGAEIIAENQGEADDLMGETANGK